LHAQPSPDSPTVRTLYLTRTPIVDNNALEPEALLTPSEVAAMFRVDPKTVTRWAKSGKLSSIRTLGGHRRFRESEVRAVLYGPGSGSVPAQREPGAES
jgi:excisionase family DNA binding protein